MVREPIDVHGLAVRLFVGIVLYVAEVQRYVEEVGDFEIRLDCHEQAERFKNFRNVLFFWLAQPHFPTDL